MKTVRDTLIIVVLGSLVVWSVVTFTRNVRSTYVQQSLIVREATDACIQDGNCESSPNFTSEVDAQAYLNGPQHNAAVNKRKTEANREVQVKQLAGQGFIKVKTACIALGEKSTVSCRLISKDTLEIYADQIIRERERLQKEHNN